VCSRDLFEQYDQDKDEKLSLNEMAEMFMALEKKVTSYPAVSGRLGCIAGSVTLH
jgi:NADH dehydrogenase